MKAHSLLEKFVRQQRFSFFLLHFLGHNDIAEVVLSSCVTQKRTQLSLFKSAVEDIYTITTKQILKGYGDGSFKYGTVPSIQCLNKHKFARSGSILTKIMRRKSSTVNAENDCSPPRKKKQEKKYVEENPCKQGNGSSQI